MAVALLHRESPGDAPGGPPTPRLGALPTHVVDQRLGCVHAHRSHWPWGHIFHRNRDRQDFVVRMSFPNAGVYCSSRPMEEGPTRSFFLWPLFQTGAFACRSDIEAEGVATPPTSLAADSNFGQERAGSRTRALVETQGPCDYSEDKRQ